MNNSKTEQVLELAKGLGVLRPRDLDAHDIPREYLRRMTQRNQLVREGRGLYRLPDSDITEFHDLAQICKRVPQGVVCLLTALVFHDLTTQSPRKLWLAIGRTARTPRLDGRKTRFVRFSGQAFTEGIEHHAIEGVDIKVYNVAKTVADCFKFRNTIGSDVAIDALKDTLREKRCSRADIHRYAKICRVANVMRPYMETL